MSDEEKKHDSCCCCKCWGRIFITIALLAIGAVIGHKMTMCHYGGMMGRPCCGWEMKGCWDRDGAEHHNRWGYKAEMGMHKPGCMCPVCCKKAASMSEPNKAVCPMMNKK